MRAWTLAVVLATTILSGCITAGDDDGDVRTGRGSMEAEEAPPAGPFDGPESVELIFTTVWAGQSTLDETVVIARDHDYLLQEISNNGQVVGHPTYTTPDGTAYDDGGFSSIAGTFSYLRTLPGDKGNAKLTMDGAAAGTGTSTVFAIDNVTPMVLLALGWSGQRVDAPVVDTRVYFWVPEGLDKLKVELTGTGQSALGIRIHDADGNEVAALENLAGPNGTTGGGPATPGMWSARISGVLAGAWTATVGVAP